MKKIIKEKYLGIILLSLISLFMLSCSNQIKDNSDNDNDVTPTNENINDKYNDINNFYAGSYYNKNGEIICCYTDKLEKVKAYITVPATFVQVNYSVNQLNETLEALNCIVGQYGIKAFGISYSENAVIVTLKNFDCLEDIKAIVNCDTIIFQQEPQDSMTVFTN